MGKRKVIEKLRGKLKENKRKKRQMNVITIEKEKYHKEKVLIIKEIDGKQKINKQVKDERWKMKVAEGWDKKKNMSK